MQIEEMSLNRSKISIAAWNVNGLTGKDLPKLDDPEFIKEISEHQIICLSETHVGPETSISIEGYHATPNNRKVCKSNNRYYGGMAVLIHLDIKKGVSVITDGDTESIWVRLKREFFGFEKDLYIGYVYVVPENSPLSDRSSDDPYAQIISKYQMYQEKGNVVIMGDMNGRTAVRYDYIANDSAEYSPLPDLYEPDRMRPRVSRDMTTNHQGNKLLEACIANRLRILNGRTLGDLTGQLTCYHPSGASVVDYVLVQEEFLSQLQHFKVHNFLAHLSDHCCISTTIYADVQRRTNTNKKKTCEARNYTWNKEIQTNFKLALLSPETIAQIRSFLTSIDGEYNPNEQVKYVNSILYNILNKCTSLKKNKKGKKRAGKKWFDSDCNTAKNRIKNLSKLRVKFPNDPHISGSLYTTKKQYKRLIKAKRHKFRNKLLHDLEHMSDNNPEQYWKILSELKKEQSSPAQKINPIPLEDWVDYFSKLYKGKRPDETRVKEITNGVKNMEMMNTFNELDFQITTEEVNKAITKLKNKKSPGIDGISSEMLKAGQGCLTPVLVKLFNHILRSKSYPEVWQVGLVSAIHKKGSVHDPDNYRGITVNSTVAKTYGLILENRLSIYIEQHKIMNKCQIGFKKKARTSDHIFIIRSLFEKYTSRGNLYLAFIDFRKAYDSVWRDALLYKILQLNIRGLFYHQIKSMYQNIQLSVKVNQHLSEKFPAEIGVKQGDVLSPILFNLFINDLPDIFDDTCDKTKLDEKYIDCLLYADDLVIISRSSQGLQNSLTKLNTYCSKWHLEVNTSKSKIMIMSKSGKKHRETFMYGGGALENVTEYTYLGIPLTNSCNFTRTKHVLKNKGTKVINKLKSLISNSPIKRSITLKLFCQIEDGMEGVKIYIEERMSLK